MRVRNVVDRSLIVNLEDPLGIAAVQLLPTHHRIRKLERTVLHAFRIQTAVRTEVDVLKKKTKQRLRNRAARLINLHDDVSRLRERDLHLNEQDRDEPTYSLLLIGVHLRVSAALVLPVMRRINSTSSTMYGVPSFRKIS